MVKVACTFIVQTMVVSLLERVSFINVIIVTSHISFHRLWI